METKNLFNVISTTVIIIASAILAGAFYLQQLDIKICIGLEILSILIASSIKIADQWEKAVLLRMGRYIGLKGPGLFFIVPILDKVFDYIDQRVRVTDFKADSTLTKDTVPVNVTATLYWMIWDVEKAALEVQDYKTAVQNIALTGLRDIIGKHELADLLQDRDKIAEDLQKLLDENTNPWGITCQTVGIKDITIPQGLSDAMSKQAQAERERKARVILGTAETEIAEKFAKASESYMIAKASESYMNNPVALQLRAMNLIGEGLKEKGSMIIVPSSALDMMNLGGISGITSLAQLHKMDQITV